MKILLIAKPWKGGLARYFHLALQDLFPGQVEWIATRPESLAERARFKRDPKAWHAALLQRVETTVCDAAFFIGWRDDYRGLRPRDNYVLYLIDDARLKPGEAEAFGRVFLSDPGYDGELRAAVSPAKYGGVLPFGFYPPLHKPQAGQCSKGDICFIGNRDEKRDPYLVRLFTDGFHPRIIGNYFLNSPLFWRHPLSFRRAVSNQEMGAIYAQHKTALNIHAHVVREGTNMRTFECAGFGIPQMVEYRTGIENYFEPEKEILCFKDADEMTAQIRSLLNNPERAKAMADAARRRALAEHTYYHRIQTALGHLLPAQSVEQKLASLKAAA